MVKIKNQNKISFFDAPALIALFSLLCALSGIFLPFLIKNNTVINFIDIFRYNYLSINILLLFIIFIALLAYFIDIFIEPGWFSYFVNASIAVILCVAPIFLAYMLSKKLGISQFAIKMHAGGILMMISALMFAGIEIYRLSTIEKKSADRIFLGNKYLLKRIYYCKKNTANADQLLENMLRKANGKKAKNMKEIFNQTLSQKNTSQNKRANVKSINTTKMKIKNPKAMIKQIQYADEDSYCDEDYYYDENDDFIEKTIENNSSPTENKLFESIKTSIQNQSSNNENKDN